MKVLVCGGRAYRSAKVIVDALEQLQPSLVIHGNAGSTYWDPVTGIVKTQGADRLAGEWALESGIPCMSFDPAWEAYGQRAGPIRNGWMLEWGQPDMVVAFPGNSGTENMVKQAEAAGVPVIRAG